MKKIIRLFLLALCAAIVFSSCKKNDPDPEPNPYDKYAVDLGLSVKWASVNVGATSEKDFGNYYAWGETVDKPDGTYYSWDTYGVFAGIGTDDESRDAAIADLFDEDLHLKSKYDVAHVQWGGSWRMPTNEEFTELSEKCTWEMVPADHDTWSADNPGGWKVTGPNGNSIFIPAAGQRTNLILDKNKGMQAIFWTANLEPDSENIYADIYIRATNYPAVGYQVVCIGNSVRPVCPVSSGK